MTALTSILRYANAILSTIEFANMRKPVKGILVSAGVECPDSYWDAAAKSLTGSKTHSCLS